MGNKFRVFGEIQKVEAQDDGSVIVSGIASSESRDGAGEVVKADAMRAAIPDYMAKSGAVREMHQPIAAGAAVAIEVDDAGVTHFTAKVVDKGSIDKVTCDPPVLKGFSIGGKVASRDPLDKTIITGIKLTEISLVDVPCNPDAVFTMAKFDNDEEGDMPEEQTPATKLQKGMWSVQDFAGILMSVGWLAQDAKWEAENEGDASPVPAKLREWFAAGAAIFQEMAAEEVQEMLATLAPKVDPLALAAPAGDLAKAGSKFSKATKEALAEIHKAMKDCDSKMAALGYDKDDKEDDEEEAAKAQAAGDLAKAADELQKAQADLAKATAQAEDLQKALDTAKAEHQATKDALEKAEANAKAKGAAKVVEKSDESKSITSPAAADATANPADPLAVMKATQAQPIGVIYHGR